MPASLRPLRNRDFALLFGSGFVSNAGNWMQTIGVGAYVTAQTQQFRWAGLAALAAFLPIGVLGPVGGAIADRVDRRRFLIFANLLEGVVATSLAVAVAGGASAPVVTGIVFAGGCVMAIRLPFLQAMTPDLVAREDLLAAASLGSAQYNLGRVIGPTIAGGAISLWGVEWVFVINAVSFLPAVVALLLIRLRYVRPTDEVPGVLARIREGARVARDEPGCRSAIGLMALAAFFAAPFIALISARALELTDGSESAVARVAGFLTTAQGLGAVVGAIVVAEMAARLGRERIVATNLVFTSVAVIVYAHMPTVVTATVAMTMLGAIYIGILSGLGTTVQIRAPAQYRGRVLSMYLVALGAVYPIGGLVQGFLADRIGLAATTTAAAVAMLAVVVYLRIARPHVFAALRDPEPVVLDEPAPPATAPGGTPVDGPVRAGPQA